MVKDPARKIPLREKKYDTVLTKRGQQDDRRVEMRPGSGTTGAEKTTK